MTVELRHEDPELDELVRRSQQVVRTLIFVLVSAGAIAFAWFAREWLWHATVLLLLASSFVALSAIAILAVLDDLRDR